MPSPRLPQESHFTTHDGVELFFRYWPAAAPRLGAIVILHRGHEHSGRMAHLVDELDLPGFDFFAWDARGHGLSPGERGFSPSIGASVRDVQTFISHITENHDLPPEHIVVIAQSVGAVLVSAWAHDYAPKIRGMVLASPAFKVKLYVPLARPGLALQQQFRGNFYVNSYVKAKFLTHDRARQASYDADPLISRAISVNILLGLYEAAERVVSDAQAITIPTQLLISGADWVVHHGPQHDFYERLGSPLKERHLLDGFYHDTFGEAGRELAVGKARDFILRLFEQAPKRRDLLEADRYGPTRQEADALARPLSLTSLRGLYWASTRFLLRLVGYLSDGVKLGHETGFDSGSSLDYVYRNQASGRGLLGRLFDRIYLDAIGWRGIRQRKLHLEELLRKAMEALQAQGKPVRVLDIAAGHGRYVLEALETSPVRPESIVLRDFSELNVRAGQALIAAKGLQDIARFEQGDAFDRASVAAVNPRPTVGIVSGLYELFADNGAVSRSLAGLAEAIEPGGYLLYTGQPWHPQLEFIARALTSHCAGQAWIMRRRSQAEMDQLVEAAGFAKLEQRVDEWGIFTVSLARRLPV
jgi:alpha-beta hydrolase superfamily lysophospholipase